MVKQQELTRDQKQELTRGQRLYARSLGDRDAGRLSLERARLVTASDKETGGLPWPLKRARAMEKILTQIPIFIEDEQLLVGDYAAKPQWSEWYPEYDSSGVPEGTGAGALPFDVLEGEALEQLEISKYWENKGLAFVYLSSKSEEEKKRAWELAEGGSRIFPLWGSMGKANASYWVVDYEKAIKKGFLGILAEVEEEIRATVVKDDESFQKVNFLKAIAIVYKAGMRYGERYAALARELASKAEGERREELNKIASVCEWVPAHPARSFHEALQTMWFCHVITHFETHPMGVCPGRMDQYLYPYYKHDIEEGSLTEEETIELLECLRVKIGSFRSGLNSYSEDGGRAFGPRDGGGGEPQFHVITLGGVTPDGEDATNELSYLFLEAAFRTKTPHPSLSVRYHDNIPEDFALRAAELAATGCGYPAFFGDKSNIAAVMGMGASLEEARNYAIGGCIVPMVPGQSGALTPLQFNAAKVFELTLHNGFDTYINKQIGSKTGRFEDFNTFDEFFDAFKEQFRQFAWEGLNTRSGLKAIREYMFPPLFYSALTEGCIESGKSGSGEGPRFYFQTCNPRGMINVIDSLAAVKKRVFDEGSIGKEELIAALRANFEGKEDVQRLLLTAPKYGNDDDYVDNIAHDVFEFWRKFTTEELETFYGHKCLAIAYSVSGHVSMGATIGALPSGRKAGETLADGSVSPAQGVDTKGPTAVINSASKIDQYPIVSTLLNMKFQPATLKTKDDLRKLLALTKTYFDDGGIHIQFNTVDKETLLDAKEHPESHRSLLVRVAGYSAYFVELNRKIQDEIIERTAHTI